jgi:hypothetical protein
MTHTTTSAPTREEQARDIANFTTDVVREITRQTDTDVIAALEQYAARVRVYSVGAGIRIDRLVVQVPEWGLTSSEILARVYATASSAIANLP